MQDAFADLIPGARGPSGGRGGRGPTAVADRELGMAATGENIESANVTQARGRTALAVDDAVIPDDIAKRRADSTKSQLDALEARTRARIPGGLATQDERQTATMYLRMLDAQMRANLAVAEDKKAAEAPLLPELVERLPLGDIASNYMVSPARRRVVSNNLDMLDAALWLSTGAAYNKEQLRNLSKAYFPQPGDDPKTLKDKNGKLNNLIQSARTRASMGLTTPGGEEAIGEVTSGRATQGAATPLPAGLTPEGVRSQARTLIKQGVPRAKVLERLMKYGVSTEGL